MRDFTLKAYRSLLEAFLRNGYKFLTFEEMMASPIEGKSVVMRHDVDEKAWNALKMAQLENMLGIHASYFREYYPVKSVCMHGSSTSKFDNRLLWEKHSLSEFGLVGEPYLSVDFEKVFYLTDTGYAWDGGKFATRDVVESHFGLKFHTTQQIVECVEDGRFPQQALILAHTLWTDSFVQWNWLHFREFARNRVKLMSKNNKWVARWYGRLVGAYWKK